MARHCFSLTRSDRPSVSNAMGEYRDLHGLISHSIFPVAHKIRGFEKSLKQLLLQ